MPNRPARPCRQPGCHLLTRTRLGYCYEHTSNHYAALDTHRPSAWKRGYDAKWRELRARVLIAQPCCLECGAKATEVDHIVALSDGGTNEPRNLRALCHRCHSARTARDQAFGRGRVETSASHIETGAGPVFNRARNRWVN